MGAAVAVAPAAQAAEILAERSVRSAPQQALAPTADPDRYLLAWAAETDDGDEIHTRLVDGSARPVTAPVRVSDVRAEGRVARATRPELVYDEQRSRFLLAYVGYWFVGQSFHSTVYAQLLDAHGRPLRSRAPLSGAMRYPDSAARLGTIAHDSVGDAFLVAWAGPSRRGPVRARLVAPDGSARGRTLRLSEMGPELSEPAVALNRRTGRFLVAWGAGGGRERVHGRTVDARSGGMSHGFAVPLATPRPPVESPYRRRAAAEPALAFDRRNERFGLTWRSEATSGGQYSEEILAQRLAGDGRERVGRGIRVSPYFLATNDHANAMPRIAYGRDDGRFTIVWENWEGGSSTLDCIRSTIYVRRLSAGWRRINAVADPLSRDDDPGEEMESAGGFRCPAQSFQPVVAARPRGEFIAAWGRDRYVLGTAR